MAAMRGEEGAEEVCTAKGREGERERERDVLVFMVLVVVVVVVVVFVVVVEGCLCDDVLACAVMLLLLFPVLGDTILTL
jgi:predicted nucleic acid-binding Zn ribbon protein